MNTRAELKEEMIAQINGGENENNNEIKEEKDWIYDMIKRNDELGDPLDVTASNGIRYYTDGNGYHSFSIE